MSGSAKSRNAVAAPVKIEVRVRSVASATLPYAMRAG